MTRARALAAAALAVLAVVAAALGAPAPARAGELFLDEDATELAQALAEAKAEQGVCYGWFVAYTGTGSSGESDVGSSEGPGRPLEASTCPKYVQLTVDMNYTCDSCEAEDSASYDVESAGLADPPTRADLDRLGYDGGDLLGDRDDEAVFNLVQALPLIVAEKGNAPFVQYELPTTVPPQDKPTGKPGSDFLRTHGLSLTLFIVLLLCGPLYYLYKRSQSASRRTGRDPGSGTISIPSKS